MLYMYVLTECAICPVQEHCQGKCGIHSNINGLSWSEQTYRVVRALGQETQQKDHPHTR